MMTTVLLSVWVASLVCAVIPCVLFCVNLGRYRAPEDGGGGGEWPQVAVLIPARNEERNLRGCVQSVLASEGVRLQVLVLDDGSTDGTAAILAELAREDARVLAAKASALPPGWNGKQHACWRLAEQSDAGLLLFLDADVRLSPDAVRRSAAELQRGGLQLLSGFPRQITVGWLEQLLLPLIHFVLLGFLPLGRMRASTDAAYAAGCGQFFLAEREAYFASGGHRAIRETRHDGLRLPELLRRSHSRTDIFDLTGLAEVRMYDSPAAVWAGLAKNATEGMATPVRIVPFTLLLALGQVLPAALLLAWLALLAEFVVVGARFDDPALAMGATAAIVLGAAASYLPRLLAVRRFRQPLRSAVLHPLGVTLLLGVQWYALARQWMGRPVAWRARAYSSVSGEEVSESGG